MDDTTLQDALYRLSRLERRVEVLERIQTSTNRLRAPATEEGGMAFGSDRDTPMSNDSYDKGMGMGGN